MASKPYVIYLTGEAVKVDGGIVVEPTGNTQNSDTQAYYAWLGQGNLPEEVNEPFKPPTPEKPKIIVDAFYARLGGLVRRNIELKCIHDPNAPVPLQNLAADLRAMKQRLTGTPFVDLASPNNQAAINGLIAAGIATQADIDRLYAQPFKAEELYRE